MRLTTFERRCLIAALLARRHLIVSGPSGTGKRQLAYEIALSITNGHKDRVCLLQGHPWWAVGTGDLGYFVDLQTSFTAWHLAYFTGSVFTERLPTTQHTSNSNPGSQTHDYTGEHIVCVQQMSRFEIELYYTVYAAWLLKREQVEARRVPIKLIGTYDSDMHPDLDDLNPNLTAVVHLSGAQRNGVTPPTAPTLDETAYRSAV